MQRPYQESGKSKKWYYEIGKTRRQSNREPQRVARRRYYKKHYAKYYAGVRASFLKRLYDLTTADFERMVWSQGGRCLICGEKPQKTKLNVDHDHKTNKVRALLCHLCNRGLGFFKDNPVLLTRAIEYLELFNDD